MPYQVIGKDITRGTITRDRWRATVTLMCSDRIPVGEGAPLLVRIQWRYKRDAGEVPGQPPEAQPIVLTWRKRTEAASGAIRFDTADGPTMRGFSTDTETLLTIYGRSASASAEADVMLDVSIEGKVRASLPLSVGSVPTQVVVGAENGLDPVPAFVVLDERIRLRAEPVLMTPGTFRWLSVNPGVLELQGNTEQAVVTFIARGAVAASRMLCVLFSPQAGPAVMRAQSIAVWPVTDPENPGPFSIGSLSYGDNDRVQKFDNTTNFITRWGSSGSFDGQFSHPEAMATDSAGHVYVIDRDNHRVQQFLPSGLFLMAWGSHGSGNGQFDHPTGVAVDSTGNIYVVDQDNHRIQKFGATGTFSAQWGSNGASDGQFNHPAGIAIDSADNVYVTDRDNHRVQKFTTTGTFITRWGNNGSSDGGFNHPIGVAVDNAGNVYITDQDNHRVQKFTATGTFVIKWGSNGSGAGQFTRPAGSCRGQPRACLCGR